MIHTIQTSLLNFMKRFQNFLFSESQAEQLGLFRFVLCGTLFYIACFRQTNIDQLGPFALIPRESALTIFPDFYRPYIQWFFWPDVYASQVHLLLIGLLFLAFIGLTNRPLMLLTWIIHQGVLNRNYSILFGADVIGGLFLFYLSFTKCCEFFSFKKIITNSKIFKKIFKTNLNSNLNVKLHPNLYSHSMLSSVFFRLMQIQICAIYMYTGFEKLKGATWWDGTALWTVFANPQFSQYDFKFLSHFPLFFAFGTFMALVFEIYFPAAMLSSKNRKYWLMGGVVFHLGIGLLLGLMTFSTIMMSTYILFLSKESIIRFTEFTKLNKTNS